MIVDIHGRPLERQALKTQQTAGLISQRYTWASHPVRGLTPTKLASIMEAAESGDLCSQSDLFLDMEERDPHLFAEMSKRRRAVLGLPWEIEPPANPTGKEKRAARQISEWVESLADLEDAILDLLDAIGHGFAALEITWERRDGVHLPSRLQHRPQSWFQLDAATLTELRLRNNSLDGEALWPFGWIAHKHAARSGYLTRAGLYRVAAWPWIMKQFSLRDLAEFLEVYGLPTKLGKYPHGADDTERATLYRAVQGLGRQAAGIMPQDMEIELLAAAQGAADPFMAMVEYSDRAISKAVLGQTLSADAHPTGLGSGVADLHGDVRHDLLISDARQLQGTLTRQLLYPIAALNGLCDDPRRSPRWVFDTGETEDMAVFADSVNKLVTAGVPVPISWVRERLGIPEPDQGEPVLKVPPTKQAATSLPPASLSGPDYAETHARALDAAASPLIAAMLARVRKELDQSESLPEFQGRLLSMYPGLETDDLTTILAEAFAASELAGRYESQAGV